MALFFLKTFGSVGTFEHHYYGYLKFDATVYKLRGAVDDGHLPDFLLYQFFAL